MAEDINLSIIIPTKNRPEILKQTLEQILIAIENTNITVFVINDGNSLTNKIISTQIEYHKNPKNGVSVARNYGASLAKTEWLLFLDDDMWITEQTIDAFNIVMNQDDNNSVYCLNWEYPKQLNIQLKKSKIGRYILNADYNTMKGRISKKLIWNNTFEKISGIGSGSLLISKSIFNKINGYNESIIFQGEDIDLSNKLKKCNIELKAYTPVTCFHNQQDRVDINGYLDREYRGYISQKYAEKEGIIINTNAKPTTKDKIYTFFVPFEKILIFLFNFVPNIAFLDSITFRLIGILSSIQKIKAYK